MISLRSATREDCMLIFQWANDSDVRKNSFSCESIDFDSHIKWYENKIKDDKSSIFIMIKDEIPVGQIRVDIKENQGFIGYSIDKNYRGEGLGTEILKLIKLKITKVDLVGYVKKENIPSIKAFEKAGYEKFEHEDFMEFIYKSHCNESLL